MTQQPAMTKAELLAQIDQVWRDFHAGFTRFTAEQIVTPQDPQGWTVKDHLAHLVAWERSCIALLQGRPRHQGLGVDEALYLRHDYDATNAAIQARTQDQPLADVLAVFRTVHQTLLELIAPLSDADLQQPYSHYLPNEPGPGDGPSVIDVIHGNTIGHYLEHLSYMQTLVAAAE